MGSTSQDGSMATVPDGLRVLPINWCWSRLEEVCHRPQYGWTTSAAETGRIRLLRTSDITSGSIDWESVPYCKAPPPEPARYILHDRDIVVSRAGSVGASCLVENPENAVFASYLIRFRALIDERFLAFFLKTPRYWNSISDRKLGIAVPNVNATRLKSIAVPVPPLNEQRRIVGKIEELFTRLDAGVAALKTVQRQLKSYHQAVLRDAFTGKLTEQWREAHRHELEPASALLERIRHEREKGVTKRRRKKLPPFDTTDLPEIPAHWGWAYLSELGELNRGKSRHRPRNDPLLFGGDYPFIQTGEVKAADVYVTDYSDTYNRMGLAQSKLWQPGTLCITIAANIAETAILAISACFPDSVVGFVPRNGVCDVKFIHYFFRTAQQQIEAFAPATAQKNINLAALWELPVPFPSPLEQRQVVEEIDRHFSLIDAAERTIERSLKQAERLRQSILKRAFEGKLVPQDPSDEPAEELLERIKVEKENVEAEAGSRKRGKKKRNRGPRQGKTSPTRLWEE